MNEEHNEYEIDRLAREIDQEVKALPVQNSPGVRTIRRKYSSLLKPQKPSYMIRLAHVLIQDYGYRGLPYELISSHPETFSSLNEEKIVALGQGLNSWWSVDSFARILSGPAWLKGLLRDELIRDWARSQDRWWRRAALVSTVALNLRSKGGYGDTTRTLAICDHLVSDHDDMVVKAMSWALRELAVLDPDAVRSYLQIYEDELAARVKREVRNKLETGLKNPKQS